MIDTDAEETGATRREILLALGAVAGALAAAPARAASMPGVPASDPAMPLAAPSSFYLDVGATAGSVAGVLPSLARIVDEATHQGVVAEADRTFALSGGRLVVAPGKTADFMGLAWVGPSSGQHFPPPGIPWYRLTIRDEAGAEAAYTVRPRYAAIQPVGDTTGTVRTVDALGAEDERGLRGRLLSRATDRTIVIDPGLEGVHAVGDRRTPIASSNLTIIGHRRAIAFKDTGPHIEGGRNLVFRDVAFRMGADFPGNKDPCRIQAGAEILFENCDFSWGIDELFSIGLSHVSLDPLPSRIRFHRCLFAEPLRDAGHSEGEHPFGLLINDNVMDVVLDKCAILGCLQRSPEVYRAYGVLVQNCVIVYGANGGHCVSTHLDLGEALHSTQIVRNNLYAPEIGNTDEQRGIAFRIFRTTDGSEVFQTGNHFFTWKAEDGGLAFPGDPLLRDRHMRLFDGATLDSIVDYPPFEPADYGLMPTATEADRIALFQDVMDHVGVRARDRGDLVPGDLAMSEIGHRIVSEFRAGTLSRPRTPDDVGGFVTGLPA